MRDILIGILIFWLVVINASNFSRGKIIEKQIEKIVRLEHEVAGKQLQIDDLHRLYPIQERRVLEIQSDLSAREVIWMLQEVAENNECIVVH